MNPVCLVVGAGPGIGQAVAVAFAREGYDIALASRHAARLAPIQAAVAKAGRRAPAYSADAADEAALRALVASVRQDLGDPEVLVYNVASVGTAKPTALDTRQLAHDFHVNVTGALVCAQELAPAMKARGRGTILFTGATASVRGSAQFAAFAAAKGGLRQVAQSMARELGPKGIHVAHVVVDGLIDNPRTRERMGDRVKELPEDGMMATDAIAETFFQLHAQPRSAWTFEADLRPWAEKF